MVKDEGRASGWGSQEEAEDADGALGRDGRPATTTTSKQLLWVMRDAGGQSLCPSNRIRHRMRGD